MIYITQGNQTIDVSKTYLSFPYIINFCNLTQVRNTTGYVRNIRRIQQAPYPLVKIQPDEVDLIAGELVMVAEESRAAGTVRCLSILNPSPLPFA